MNPGFDQPLNEEEAFGPAAGEVVQVDRPRGEATTKVYAARAGDDRALDELISLLYPTVRGFVFSITRPTEAFAREDLVQTSLENLCRSLDRFEGRSRFTSYVYGVCFRVVSNWRRTEKVRRLFRLRAQTAPPAHDSQALETKEWAANVLAKLTDEELSAWVMYVSDGLSREEIAAVLGKSLATTKRRIQSARDKIAAEGER